MLKGICTRSVLLSIVVLASCVSPPPYTPGPQPELVVKWLSSCSDRSGRDLFAVSVFANDDVVFLGGPRSREVGERREQLVSGTALHVRELVETVLSASVAARSRPRLDRDDTYVGPCIEIQHRTYAGLTKVRADSSSRAGVAFTDAIVEALPLKRWVCPARNVESTSSDGPGDFCNKWYMLDVVGATINTPAGCPSNHTVRVYEDGTVHYALQEIHFGPGPTRFWTASEKYYVIDRASVDRLVHLVASFELYEDHTQSICWSKGGQAYGCPPATVAPTTTNPADLIRFREALEEAVGIEWGDLSAEPQIACSPNADRTGSVWLAWSLRELAKNRK